MRLEVAIIDFDDLLLSGMGVACVSGSLEAGGCATGFWGVFRLGSGRSGREGSSRAGEEAVRQLPLEYIVVFADGVEPYSRRSADVNKPKCGMKAAVACAYLLETS